MWQSKISQQMFITIQPEVYEDIFYHKNIMAAHKIVTHLTLMEGPQTYIAQWTVFVESYPQEGDVMPHWLTS